MNIVGIDPGKTTGIALIKDKCLVELSSTDFWGAIGKISTEVDYINSVVVIELPANKHVWHGGAMAKAAIQRTGVNVGSCIREAELIIKWLDRNNRQYVIQRPSGKMCSDDFNAITSWQGRTNQHERDAGLMAWKYRGMK